jgi:hypothetical protein
MKCFYRIENIVAYKNYSINIIIKMSDRLQTGEQIKQFLYTNPSYGKNQDERKFRRILSYPHNF